MKKNLRIAAMITAHAALLLSILYLVFFLVCTVRSANAASKLSASEPVSEQDLYLEQAMRERDFSLYTVGKALSSDSNSARENLLVAADLIIPALFIASGVLLQITATRRKRKQAAVSQQKQAISSTGRR